MTRSIRFSMLFAVLTGAVVSAEAGRNSSNLARDNLSANLSHQFQLGTLTGLGDSGSTSCPAGKYDVQGWTVTSGSSYCALSAGSATDTFCIQDTSGDYGNNEDCAFTFTGAATVTREEWGLEASSSCSYDYLQVDGGAKYCGSASDATAFPASFPTSDNVTSFAFHTDGSVTALASSFVQLLDA